MTVDVLQRPTNRCAGCDHYRNLHAQWSGKCSFNGCSCVIFSQKVKKRGSKRSIPETITEKEFLQIQSLVDKPHYRLAFGLGFYQAMRVSEIVKLLPEH